MLTVNSGPFWRGHDQPEGRRRRSQGVSQGWRSNEGSWRMFAFGVSGAPPNRAQVSLWVFPEGTRSSKPDPTLLPFKKGAFHLAVQAQVPIVPVVCENYWRLFDGRGKMEGGDLRLKGKAWQSGLRARLTRAVLPPIPTEGLTVSDVDGLVETTREAMLSTLIEISEPGPSQWKTVEGARVFTEETAESENRSKASNPSPSPEGTSAAGDDARATDTDHSTEDEMDDDAVVLKRPQAV